MNSILFDEKSYLEANQDVAKAVKNGSFKSGHKYNENTDFAVAYDNIVNDWI